jgi:hypothetical protein
MRGHARALALLLTLALGAAAAGCGSESSAAPAHRGAQASRGGQSSASGHAGRVPAATVSARPSGAPIVSEPGQLGSRWAVVATVGGAPATWIEERSGVTLLRFNQQLVHLDLHAGSSEPEGRGWGYGDQIAPSEAHRVIAAFNGGFKLDYGSVAFVSGGRVAVPLQAGLASIVTYRNGVTAIAAWHQGVPAVGLKIASVLQNLHLLVDQGVVAPTATSCVIACWGRTLGGGTDVPRSALGITSEGQLVWAAGASLSPAALGRAMAAVGVVRAAELDINPEWVAGYLYVHHGGGPTAVPVMPGQLGIPGHLLAPYSRDFFTIVAN